jgi:sarcosine oxidase
MGEQIADVIVVGAGIMGAAAAWQLARRGLHVRVYEQFALDHLRGSSHGASRIFRFAYDNPTYIHLAQQALPLWRQAEADLGQDLLAISGTLDFGPVEALQPTALALTTAGVPFERVSAAQIAARYPDFALPPAWEAIYQADGGILYADDCRLGLIELARRAGAEIYPDTRVERLVPDANGMTVQTNTGSARAAFVVLTAAGWSNRLLEPLGLAVPLKITREHIAYYPYRNHRRTLPFIVHDSARSFDFYGLPNGRQPSIKVGEHGVGPVIEPESEPVLESERLDPVHAWVRAHLPAVWPEPIGADTCLYASTPDDDFVIERFDRLVLGMGFGGHGFKFGAVIGSLLADLVQGNPIPFADYFSRARFDAGGFEGVS